MATDSTYATPSISRHGTKPLGVRALCSARVAPRSLATPGQPLGGGGGPRPPGGSTFAGGGGREAPCCRGARAPGANAHAQESRPPAPAAGGGGDGAGARTPADDDAAGPR